MKTARRSQSGGYGKTWSKSNDQQKIELACRELEVAQGWSHDRGRFDFEVKEVNGVATVSLLPNEPHLTCAVLRYINERC